MVQKTIMRVQKKDHYAQTTTRKAVRAVIEREDKLLMIYSNRIGDFKFPGGGFKFGETESDVLKREVLEESGYRIKAIQNRIAEIIEVQQDKDQMHTIFEMRSTYYSCEIHDEHGQQELDEYEAEGNRAFA